MKKKKGSWQIRQAGNESHLFWVGVDPADKPTPKSLVEYLQRLEPEGWKCYRINPREFTNEYFLVLSKTPPQEQEHARKLTIEEFVFWYFWRGDETTEAFKQILVR